MASINNNYVYLTGHRLHPLGSRQSASSPSEEFSADRRGDPGPHSPRGGGVGQGYFCGKNGLLIAEPNPTSYFKASLPRAVMCQAIPETPPWVGGGPPRPTLGAIDNDNFAIKAGVAAVHRLADRGFTNLKPGHLQTDGTDFPACAGPGGSLQLQIIFNAYCFSSRAFHGYQHFGLAGGTSAALPGLGSTEVSVVQISVKYFLIKLKINQN